MGMITNVVIGSAVMTAMTTLSYYGVKYLVGNTISRIRGDGLVSVRHHTRRFPEVANEDGFGSFRKHRFSGLKGNNPSRFREEKIKEARKTKIQKLWEKMEHYDRVGDSQKKRAIAREIERMDKYG